MHKQATATPDTIDGSAAKVSPHQVSPAIAGARSRAIHTAGSRLQPHDILHLQRTVGNHYVQRLLATRSSQQAGVIQRFVPQNLGGALDHQAYQRRHAHGDFGIANKGWIELNIPAGVAIPNIALLNGIAGVYLPPALQQGSNSIHATSTGPNGSHAEEVLVQAAQALGVNFALAPNAPGGISVVRMYTERAPCSPNENIGKLRATRGTGGCWGDLQARLHPAVVVSYSVPNTDHEHGDLLLAVKIRSLKQWATQQIEAAYTATSARLLARVNSHAIAVPAGGQLLTHIQQLRDDYVRYFRQIQPVQFDGAYHMIVLEVQDFVRNGTQAINQSVL